MQKNEYYDQAVECVKGGVLEEQRRQFEECNRDMDELYGKYKENEFYYRKIIEKGHIYEMGYPRCLCSLVAEGKCDSPKLCECSRQSILYVLNEISPERKFEVETIETVLGGSPKCRFRITMS